MSNQNKAFESPPHAKYQVKLLLTYPLLIVLLTLSLILFDSTSKTAFANELKYEIEDTFTLSGSPPMTLTASRLKQALSETPASVTSIDAKLIQALGITSIPDALRLVPGMVVGYDQSNEGHSSSISYHGTEMEPAIRQQVLIDGRSVYLPGLARVK